MSRDPQLIKRNAFVISGALLAFVCMVAMLYGLGLRPDPGYDCRYEGAGMLLWGRCYHVATVFTPPLVLAAFLIVFGMLRYRGEPEDLEAYLHAGTGQHVVLSLILAVIGLPALMWIALKVMENRDGTIHVIPFLSTRYELTFLLELMALVGILLLLAFLAAYLAQMRMRSQFLAAAQAMSREAASEEDEDYGPQDDELWDEADEEPAPAEGDQEEPWQDLPTDASQEAPAAVADDGADEEPLEDIQEPEEEPEPTETPMQQVDEEPVRARPEDTFGDDPDAAPLADDEDW